jgi:hypothetical protein
MPTLPVPFRASFLRNLDSLGKSLCFRWQDQINVTLTCNQLLLGQSFNIVSSFLITSIKQLFCTKKGENIPQIANGMPKALKEGKRKLWIHTDPETTKMADFMHSVN